MFSKASDGMRQPAVRQSNARDSAILPCLTVCQMS
jgi:hypothetical protein